MKNIILIILGAIIITAIAYSLWQEKYNSETFDLKLSLKASESYELKYTLSQTLTHTVYTQPEQANIKAEVIVGLDVINVDANGTMGVDLFCRAIKLTVDSPYIDIDTTNMKPTDTNNPYQTAIADVYLATIGNRFRMKISPVGRISDISGFDELMAKTDAKAKERSIININDIGIKDKNAAEEMKAMIEKNVSDRLSMLYRRVFADIRDDVKQMIESIIVRFSDWPVSAGNKWCEKSHLNLGFPDLSDVNTTYTFKRCEDNSVYIEAISEIDMKKLTSTEINYSDTVSRRMSGTMVSFNLLNKDNGLLQKSESTMKFSGIEKREPDRLILPLRPTMTIPITLEGKVVIERIK